MRKIFMLIGLMTASSALAAVDCSTVKVSSFLNFSYSTLATFPNPKETVSKYFEEKFSFADCGFMVSSNGEEVVIKANSPQALEEITDQDKLIYVSMYGISGYKYPAIREGFYYISLAVTFDKNTRKIDASGDSSFFSSIAVGYKVNGGPLTPLYYQGKSIPAELSNNISTLEFFGSSSSYVNYQRIKIDFTNNTITLSKRYPFPSN